MVNLTHKTTKARQWNDANSFVFAVLQFDLEPLQYPMNIMKNLSKLIGSFALASCYFARLQVFGNV